jgi:hypothetical protein
MARELYVRPPVVAAEPPSSVVAAWRFRILGAVLLIALVLLVVVLFVRFSNITGGEDPGLGGAFRPAPPVAAAR